jgi:hypothetical protein
MILLFIEVFREQVVGVITLKELREAIFADESAQRTNS